MPTPAGRINANHTDIRGIISIMPLLIPAAELLPAEAAAVCFMVKMVIRTDVSPDRIGIIHRILNWPTDGVWVRSMPRKLRFRVLTASTKPGMPEKASGFC